MYSEYNKCILNAPNKQNVLPKTTHEVDDWDKSLIIKFGWKPVDWNKKKLKPISIIINTDFNI